MPAYVYILASCRMGTLYTGVTNDIARRVREHKASLIKGFTSDYKVTNLVWYESFERFDEAIAFEKRVKRWRRDWKIDLIEKMNPSWDDLYLDLTA